MVKDSTSERADKEELPNTSKLDFKISPGLTGYDYGVVVNININRKDLIVRTACIRSKSRDLMKLSS